MELLPLQPDNGASKYPSILVITPIWLHLAVISTTTVPKLRIGCNLSIMMVENILLIKGKPFVLGIFIISGTFESFLACNFILGVNWANVEFAGTLWLQQMWR